MFSLNISPFSRIVTRNSAVDDVWKLNAKYYVCNIISLTQYSVICKFNVGLLRQL